MAATGDFGSSGSGAGGSGGGSGGGFGSGGSEGSGSSPEADYLRTNWDEKFLKKYDGLWIAVVVNKVFTGETSEKARVNAMQNSSFEYEPLVAFVTNDAI